MAEQIAQLQSEIMDLKALMRDSATKDLSLISIIPRWSGSHRALPLNEFFEAIEGSASIGNWSESDCKHICILKLTDAAKAFYNASIELRDPNITWQNFKLAFGKGFSDFRSCQYYFMELRLAKQAKNETPQDFFERIRILVHHTFPTTDDPEIRKIYQKEADRMILDIFSAKLVGTPGMQVRLRRPENIKDAVQIAVHVAQVERQQRCETGRPLESAQNPANSRRPSKQTTSAAKPDQGRHRTRNRQPSSNHD
jgi:hypothetical protein